MELERRGPGLLLADLVKGDDPQIAAVTQVAATLDADVLVLASVDYDLEGRALAALADRLAEAGAEYPHRFARRPNRGMRAGVDLDGDGRQGGPGDSQGWGTFPGQGGLAILSRLPIDADAARDFSAFLWRDLPGALLPAPGEAGALPPEVADVQRLSTTAHWEVPVVLPSGGRLALLTWHATPPVFDGPEDRNGRRNHDETAFWSALIGGKLSDEPPAAPFVLLGDANLDPADGDGRPAALEALLADPAVQDPAPSSGGGVASAAAQGGANLRQSGPPGLDTVDWPDGPGGPGNLRVDYVLPSADLTVTGAGVFWPAPGEPLAEVAEAASRHRAVWVDLDLPGG